MKVIQSTLKNGPAWVQAVSSVCLIIVTIVYVVLTHNIFKIQVEPLIDLSAAQTQGSPIILLSNRGVYPVVNVTVDVKIVAPTSPGSPTHFRRLFGDDTPEGRTPFFSVVKLSPGLSVSRVIRDVADKALEIVKVAEAETRSQKEALETTSPAAKELAGISQQSYVPGYTDYVGFEPVSGMGGFEPTHAVGSSPTYAVGSSPTYVIGMPPPQVVFRITYHRDVDLKPYQKIKRFSYIAAGKTPVVMFFPLPSAEEDF